MLLRRDKSGPNAGMSAQLCICCVDAAVLLQAETQATLKRLSPDTLMAVLRSDNLRVPTEMHVFRSVVRWLEADKSRLPQVGFWSPTQLSLEDNLPHLREAITCSACHRCGACT